MFKCQITRNAPKKLLHEQMTPERNIYIMSLTIPIQETEQFQEEIHEKSQHKRVTLFFLSDTDEKTFISIQVSEKRERERERERERKKKRKRERESAGLPSCFNHKQNEPSFAFPRSPTSLYASLHAQTQLGISLHFPPLPSTYRPQHRRK